jgi:hypothetical protein
MAAIMKVIVFWDVVPYSLVEVVQDVSEVLTTFIIRAMSPHFFVVH